MPPVDLPEIPAASAPLALASSIGVPQRGMGQELEPGLHLNVDDSKVQIMQSAGRSPIAKRWSLIFGGLVPLELAYDLFFNPYLSFIPLLFLFPAAAWAIGEAFYANTEMIASPGALKSHRTIYGLTKTRIFKHDRIGHIEVRPRETGIWKKTGILLFNVVVRDHQGRPLARVREVADRQGAEHMATALGRVLGVPVEGVSPHDH
jgi:hypothetical protein